MGVAKSTSMEILRITTWNIDNVNMSCLVPQITAVLNNQDIFSSATSVDCIARMDIVGKQMKQIISDHCNLKETGQQYKF